MTSEPETNWLQERKLKDVLPQPLSGFVSLAVIVLLSQLIWYFLFSPNGYVKLYTPNTGLALVITILMVIHWGMDVFDFWPFRRDFLRNAHPVVKGISLTAFSIGMGLFVMYVIYENIIGRFGAIFFSGPRLIASGGLGQYSQTATENAFYAQIMMNTCIIFFTILWVTSFRYKPWQDDVKATRAFSVWLLGLLLAIVAFVFLFYPHIAHQFYPPQIFMAVSPWWEQWAKTQSSIFHFGWIVPSLVMLYWTSMLWEGRPFSLIGNLWLRGIVTVLSVIVLGISFMLTSNAVMDWYFDSEMIPGGMATEQPAWRWNHVAEIVMFMAVAGSILYHYFDNWPRNPRLPLRALTRTLIAVGGGLLICKLYYVLGPIFLGTVAGLGQENDTSLCWTVMFLVLLIVHAVFFDGYPFRKQAE